MKRVLLALFLAVAAVAVAAPVEFQLTDVKGNPVTISTANADATVLVFIATKCPISNDYNERMKKLHGDFAGRKVQFAFVNANVSEPADEVVSHARSNGFAFQVYKDVDNVLADKYSAQFTPEVFVFAKDGTQKYHGAIDDSRNAAKITREHLRIALDEILTGKAVTTSDTKAFGCTIKRAKKAS